jgi:hypothetical protein
MRPDARVTGKQLEGGWEGALPGGRETVTFHFKNRPDRTVEATATNLGLPGKTQAFARVMQSGAEVDLRLFIFGASYKGTIDARTGTDSVQFVESRMGASTDAEAPPRFPSPLIKPDVRISRIRLSDWLHR